MQLGLVGLGRMGANMATRLTQAGHDVVGYDADPGRSDVGSLEELVACLEAPRAVWVMVPSGAPTRETVATLADLLSAGDVLAEGGNSHWSDDRSHADLLATRGIGFCDVGVSGGVWGLTEGYALMVGGSGDAVARLQPAFDALRPAGEGGFVHAGDVGAGHFAKMVHNGIEYGLMQAYAEGYEMLAASDVVTDVPGVLSSWTEGTVVRSWLLDLLVRALDEDPALERLVGHVNDSGEGRWSVQEAVDLAVPAPVISAALFARFASRQEDSPAMRVVAALRQQFGGHAVTSAGAPSAPASPGASPSAGERG